MSRSSEVMKTKRVMRPSAPHRMNLNLVAADRGARSVDVDINSPFAWLDGAKYANVAQDGWKVPRRAKGDQKSGPFWVRIASATGKAVERSP